MTARLNAALVLVCSVGATTVSGRLSNAADMVPSEGVILARSGSWDGTIMGRCRQPASLSREAVDDRAAYASRIWKTVL